MEQKEVPKHLSSTCNRIWHLNLQLEPNGNSNPQTNCCTRYANEQTLSKSQSHTFHCSHWTTNQSRTVPKPSNQVANFAFKNNKNHRDHHKKKKTTFVPKLIKTRYTIVRNINTITTKQSTVIPRNRHQRSKTLITKCNTTLQNPKLQQRRFSLEQNNYLIQDETLALSRPTTDGDDADGLLDELERRDGFRIHAELPLLIAVDEAYGSGGAGDWRRRRGRRRGDRGGGR